MSDEHLLEHVDDKVATITLNRPDALNAVTREMLKDLYDKVERLAEDPDVGAIVLRGAGRAFCSGGDVKSMAAGKDANASLETRAQTLRNRMEVSRLLHEVPKPTIAMDLAPLQSWVLALREVDERLPCGCVRSVPAFQGSH